MSEFLSVVKMFMVCGTLVAIAMIVLLSMPQSRLRAVGLEVTKWAMVGGLVLLIFSPLDLLPGLPIDDLIYLIAAIASGGSAVEDRKRRLLIEQAELSQILEKKES